MKLHFIDFSTWKEHDVESKKDCKNETEERLRLRKMLISEWVKE